MLNSNGVCKKIECNKHSEARERERESKLCEISKFINQKQLQKDYIA